MRGKLWFCAAALAAAALLTACGGAEAPASAVPPASSEVPAPSEPEPEPEPPSEPDSSSASSEPASSSQPEKENPYIKDGILISYDTGEMTQVVLPSGKFTKISNGCFKNNTKIESVVIPEGVTEIGPSAFAGCKNLKYVQLPKTLTTIEYAAFEKCEALREIDLSRCGVLTIETAAFQKTGLRRVVIPQNIGKMKSDVFIDCASLTEVQVDGLKTIPAQTFARCGALQTVTLGPWVTEIEEGAFFNCPVKTVYYDGDWAVLASNTAAGNETLLNAERKTGTPTT